MLVFLVPYDLRLRLFKSECSSAWIFMSGRAKTCQDWGKQCKAGDSSHMTWKLFCNCNALSPLWTHRSSTVTDSSCTRKQYIWSAAAQSLVCSQQHRPGEVAFRFALGLPTPVAAVAAIHACGAPFSSRAGFYTTGHAVRNGSSAMSWQNTHSSQGGKPTAQKKPRLPWICFCILSWFGLE